MLLNFLHKSKQFFFVLIKLSIVVAAFYLIIQKLLQNDKLKFNDFWLILINTDAFSTKTLLFLVLLSSFNWFFEILKWQILVAQVKEISFKTAAQQCLTALTVSIVTPNRIGDYGAKALFFNSHNRGKILLLNFVGNLWQMAVTIVFGVGGLLILYARFHFKPLQFEFWQLSIPAVFLIILYLLRRFKNHQIQGFSIRQILNFAQNIPLIRHTKVAAISALRYLVFSAQLFFLLRLLGADISYLDAMAAISAMYLLASIIPMVQLFDAAIKGSIAILLLSLFHVPAVVVLSAVTCMWLLNVVLPAILGSAYLFNFKTAKVA